MKTTRKRDLEGRSAASGAGPADQAALPSRRAHGGKGGCQENNDLLPKPQFNAKQLRDEKRSHGFIESGPVHIDRGAKVQDKQGSIA